MIRAEEGPAPRAGTALDGVLIAALLALTAIGAVMVYSASAIPAGACATSRYSSGGTTDSGR